MVAWGLPYFQHYIPRLEKSSSYFHTGTSYPAYLPVDLITSKERGHTVYALQEARTFPSDEPPPGFGSVRLEQNDVAVLLRGDSLDNIMAATNAIFGTGNNQAGDLFKVTSIRRGFTGGADPAALPSLLPARRVPRLTWRARRGDPCGAAVLGARGRLGTAGPGGAPAKVRCRRALIAGRIRE
ncbi:hypothetical protein ACQP25_01440 [Microtetraspora malaysiensis]|uniref:hypothetical protein n=1 Tax=Microtetraspora malaysiensis TaxID=161358 RepID=UPI003D8EC175